MAHVLPELPYALDALEPHISRETLETHHGKHHRAYVDKLNELIKGGQFESLPLEEAVRKSSGAIFNNAAQAWNHGFFWQCLGPDAPPRPGDALRKAIEGIFGSLDGFKDRFTRVALDTFGSGWTWLTLGRDGSLSIQSTGNADTPIKGGGVPLLTCDLWEHAYYIDYRNRRPEYLKAFWRVTNWAFADDNYGDHEWTLSQARVKSHS
jgi:Fe-Mn family superoxide dismutase